MSEDAADLPLMQSDETLSPVDLPGAEPGYRPLLWTSGAIATAALFLLLTNAATLDGWAQELPPSAVAERVTEYTGRWAALTRYLGSPHAWLHQQWKRAENAKF